MQCSVKEIHAHSPIPTCQTGRRLFFVGNLHQCHSSFKAIGTTDYPLLWHAAPCSLPSKISDWNHLLEVLLKKLMMFLIFRPSLTPKSHFLTGQELGKHSGISNVANVLRKTQNKRTKMRQKAKAIIEVCAKISFISLISTLEMSPILRPLEGVPSPHWVSTGCSAFRPANLEKSRKTCQGQRCCWE